MKRCFATFAVATVLAVSSSCSDADSPAAPSPADALTESRTSANYDFHLSSGDNVDAPRQEAFHDWVVPRLGITVSRRLQYSKYRDRAHLQRVTGMATNGFADPPAFAVHSIFPWDAHESVHVYTALVGRPSDFFNEGIAVALSVDPLEGRFVSLWNSTPIHDIARNLKRTNALPSIVGIAETEAFRRQNDQTSYPVAGSFVSFLIDQHGLPAMMAFFRAGTRDDARGAIEVKFSNAFGRELLEAEARWRDFLQ